MKNLNWTVIRNFARFFLNYALGYFGLMILVRHYVFHNDFDPAYMNEFLFESIFFSSFMTVLSRHRWYKKDEDVYVFNSTHQADTKK